MEANVISEALNTKILVSRCFSCAHYMLYAAHIFCIKPLYGSLNIISSGYSHHYNEFYSPIQMFFHFFTLHFEMQIGLVCLLTYYISHSQLYFESVWFDRTAHYCTVHLSAIVNIFVCEFGSWIDLNFEWTSLLTSWSHIHTILRFGKMRTFVKSWTFCPLALWFRKHLKPFKVSAAHNSLCFEAFTC